MLELTTGLELILNASENVLQIGLVDDENPLCFQQWHFPGRATEILTPALADMFASLQLKPGTLRRIACVNGPGSFTGIRLILSTAAAIRRVTGAQLASLDYLQALATSAVMRGTLLYGAKIYVLTHARRNLIHFQPFISFGPQIPAQPTSAVSLLEPEQIFNLVEKGIVYICGSALKMYPEIFEPARTGEGLLNLPDAVLMPNLINPDWEALRLLARHGDYFPKDLEPGYVRNCDAVDNLSELSARRGKNPEEEQRKLEDLLKRGIGEDS